MLFSFHSYLYRMRFQFEWLALYSPKKDAKRLQYRMNSNRGIFFRFATSGSESVFVRKRLEILSIPFDDYSFGFQSREKRAVERRAEFSEMNEDGYGDDSIEIRAFSRLAFSTLSRRRKRALAFILHLASIQFSWKKIKRSASRLFRDTVAFARLGDSRERASEPWEISDRRDRSHKVNRRC